MSENALVQVIWFILARSTYGTCTESTDRVEDKLFLPHWRNAIPSISYPTCGKMNAHGRAH